LDPVVNIRVCVVWVHTALECPRAS